MTVSILLLNLFIVFTTFEGLCSFMFDLTGVSSLTPYSRKASFAPIYPLSPKRVPFMSWAKSKATFLSSVLAALKAIPMDNASHGSQQVSFESVVGLLFGGAIPVACLTFKNPRKVCPSEVAHGDGKAVDDVDIVVKGTELSGQISLQNLFDLPQIGRLSDECTSVPYRREEVSPVAFKIGVDLLICVHPEEFSNGFHGEDLVVAKARPWSSVLQIVKSGKFFEKIVYEAKDFDDKLFSRHNPSLG